MTISKERLNILQQTFKATAKGSEALEAAALNDAAAAISELLAVREAQPVASTTKSNIDAVLSGVSTVIWPVRCFKGKTHVDLYTAPHAQVVPQSDHLKRALKLAGEAKELADRIRAEEQMLPAVLGEQLINIANHIAGSEGGLPDEWKDWASELVSDLRRLAKSKAVPVVPGDAEFNAWVQRDYNREVTLSCSVNLGIAKSAWKGCCTAILEGQKG